MTGEDRSTSLPRSLSLKVDVCTHEGFARGVPRLLDQLDRHRARASFFLSCGPDNSGKALLNAWKPSFLRKMAGSGAPSLYGWRTMVSGTLLPARPTATAFPDLVRRIAAEGHEVAVHAWDHRRWQDHLRGMDTAEIREHYERAIAACESITGARPRGTGAAAWLVTERSLRIEDEMGFEYASDLRGGEPCRLRGPTLALRTPQIPTTGRCIEELLPCGIRGDEALARALLDDLARVSTAVMAVHAEVEGGPYAGVLDRVLPPLVERFGAPQLLADVAAALARSPLPVRDLAYTALPGRSGRVATSADPVTVP